MPTYVALMRGFGPGNPNMKADKLKPFFESLGFTKVAVVISSGNIVFDVDSADTAAMEKKIEKEMPEKLGFSRTAIVRSEEELKKLVKSNPFKGIKDEKPNYLVVTFFKDRKKELCSVIDMEDAKNGGGGFMAILERTHGKEVTTRTWKTVHRILKKIEEIHQTAK